MRAAMLAGGAAGVAWAAPALAPIVPPVSAALRIPRRLAGAGGEVAVTFDDGPHPQGTPAALRALEAAGVRATFFLVGEQVERNPGLAREIAQAGHEVAAHGHRHRNLLRVRPRALADDFERVHATIAERVGVEPALYRPPYGIFSPAGLALAHSRGWRPLLWSRWGRDWAAHATPESIAHTVIRGLRERDVVLLHDADHYSAEGSWKRTAAALPRILEEIGGRGLRPVAVGAELG